jgi:outer membrane biosynthesis protein TonB
MTMAFETFLTVDKQKPKKGRRIMFAVSLGVHAALLAVGVATSFASVEELGPKNGGPIVTIGMLPVPPPPPAGKKQTNKVKTKTVTKVVRPPNSIVAPTEHTKEEQVEEDGDDENGEKDGIIGGHGIGTAGPAAETTHTLPPNVAKGFLAIDPQDPRYRPHMPPGYRGVSVWALMRVCTDRDGNVVEVKVLKGFDPAVDAAFVSALRTWRYTPFKVEGRPVPFCTNVRYEVQTTN